MPSWGLVLLACGVALFPWEAWGTLHLAENLTACLPAWEEPKLLPTWEGHSQEEGLLGGTVLTAWEVALCLERWEPFCLPAWEATKLLPS